MHYIYAVLKVNKSNTSIDFNINAEESAVYELIRETDRFIGQREATSRLTLIHFLKSLLLDTVNQVSRRCSDGTIRCRLQKLNNQKLKVEIGSDLPEFKLIWECWNE